MKTNLLLVPFTVLLLLFSSCQKEKDLVTPQPGNNHTLRSASNCESDFTLVAGQSFVAGEIRILSDNDSVYVGYVTEGWTITETHLFVGNGHALPINTNGTPAPSSFPIASNFGPGVRMAWYSFPISSLPQCGSIAAYAVLANNTTGRTETGWSEGVHFTNNDWAMHSEYCLCDHTPLTTSANSPSGNSH